MKTKQNLRRKFIGAVFSLLMVVILILSGCSSFSNTNPYRKGLFTTSLKTLDEISVVIPDSQREEMKKEIRSFLDEYFSFFDILYSQSPRFFSQEELGQLLVEKLKNQSHRVVILGETHSVAEEMQTAIFLIGAVARNYPVGLFAEEGESFASEKYVGFPVNPRLCSYPAQVLTEVPFPNLPDFIKMQFEGKSPLFDLLCKYQIPIINNFPVFYPDEVKKVLEPLAPQTCLIIYSGSAHVANIWRDHVDVVLGEGVDFGYGPENPMPTLEESLEKIGEKPIMVIMSSLDWSGGIIQNFWLNKIVIQSGYDLLTIQKYLSVFPQAWEEKVSSYPAAIFQQGEPVFVQHPEQNNLFFWIWGNSKEPKEIKFLNHLLKNSTFREWFQKQLKNLACIGVCWDAGGQRWLDKTKITKTPQKYIYEVEEQRIELIAEDRSYYSVYYLPAKKTIEAYESTRDPNESFARSVEKRIKENLFYKKKGLD